MFKPICLAALLISAACSRSADLPPIAVPVELAAAGDGGVRTWVTVDSARKAVIVYAGPYHVPVADPSHHDMPHDLVGHNTPLVEFTWPVGGWFRGFQISLHDASGRELPRNLMHHLVGYDLGRRPLIHPGVVRLFGVGLETSDIVLPEMVGVPMPAGSPIGFNVTWHNETGEEIHGAYVRLVLPYTPDRPEGIRIEGFPFHAEVNYQIEGTTAFDLPPGRSEHDFEFTMPIDGGLIAVSGHMHDHGVRLRLEEVESGRMVFALNARRDSEGKLLGIEQKTFRSWFGLRDARLPLRAGVRYRVVGEYDNPTGSTIASGAMAHVVGLFAPADVAEWPALDPNDPALIRDLAALRGTSLPVATPAEAPAAHQHH